MPAQNGTTPRGTARVTARRPLIDSGTKRERNSSGANARMPASSALSSTGISAITPRTRSGASTATSREALAPSEVPPTTAWSMPTVVQQRDDLLAEGGHGVLERVLGAVRAPVAEHVHGQHVRPGGGQVAREGLVHPARHQLPVHEHDPAVAAAVLGVLQPVAVVEELADPLRNQGHGVTLARAAAADVVDIRVVGGGKTPQKPTLWWTISR